MKLGNLELENNLFLAPLQNTTTAPFRRFCRKFYEIGLVSVPMIYTKNIMNNPKSIEYELYKIENETPISVQLIGNDKESLKKAIEYLESYKFNVIDINAGCPSKRAIRGEYGGYLLRDLYKLEDLLETAVKYSSKPISLKTRLGFKRPKKIDEFAKIINDVGIEFATIHTRLVSDRFDDSTLDLDTLKKLKEVVEIPLVGNGDITNPIFAKHFLDYTNVDALMIGRGAMGNPEIFRQIDEYLTNGIEIPFNNNKTQLKTKIELYEQVLDDYLEGAILKFSHEEYKFMELKRNSIWLTRNIEKSTIIRENLSKTRNLVQLREELIKIYKRN